LPLCYILACPVVVVDTGNRFPTKEVSIEVLNDRLACPLSLAQWPSLIQAPVMCVLVLEYASVSISSIVSPPSALAPVGEAVPVMDLVP
ncbi:hypothetical protein L0F63_006996, partial [Massospora cicadina]